MKCKHCLGTGFVLQQTGDNESDFIVDTCEHCNGRGEVNE